MSTDKKSVATKIKIRRFWTRSPATQIKKSARIYKRSKIKQETKNMLEQGQGVI